MALVPPWMLQLHHAPPKPTTCTPITLQLLAVCNEISEAVASGNPEAFSSRLPIQQVRLVAHCQLKK